ncbi:hypothetical protein PHYC_01790 [Phycisphaerales bacterium]|nr:hypothetical protein PHYC_01790 [Phycisphaerales bacterium]
MTALAQPTPLSPVSRPSLSLCDLPPDPAARPGDPVPLAEPLDAPRNPHHPHHPDDPDDSPARPHTDPPSTLLLDGRGGYSYHPTADLPKLILDFNPSAQVAAHILEALCDPQYSLLAVARMHDATLDALLAWMDRPDIQARMARAQTATSRRNRLAATSLLHRVLTGLERSVDEYIDEVANDPLDPTDRSAREQRRRSRETSRKASWLIYLISRSHPTPAPTDPPPSNTRDTANPAHPARRKPPRATASDSSDPDSPETLTVKPATPPASRRATHPTSQRPPPVT